MSQVRSQFARRVWWRALAVLLAISAPSVSFATERQVTTTITSIYAYTQFGNGDVAVTVATAPTGCEAGFWLRKSDLGFNSTYALLLSAYHAGATVRIAGQDSDLWTGSGDHYCRITFAGAT